MELKPDMGFASLIHERIFIKDILAINAFVDFSLQKTLNQLPKETLSFTGRVYVMLR